MVKINNVFLHSIVDPFFLATIIELMKPINTPTVKAIAPPIEPKTGTKIK